MIFLEQRSSDVEENKMAEGLIADCRLLLSRFENLNTVRFEKFCEVWREMNFSLIHWYAFVSLMKIFGQIMVES